MKSLIILILFTLISCTDYDCDDQIKDITDTHGPAEEVNTYNTKDYHNMDLWYWSKGFQYSFTWGDDIKGCDVSKYTFPPIKNDSMKAMTIDSMVLDYRIFCPNTKMPTQ